MAADTAVFPPFCCAYHRMNYFGLCCTIREIRKTKICPQSPGENFQSRQTLQLRQINITGYKQIIKRKKKTIIMFIHYIDSTLPNIIADNDNSPNSWISPLISPQPHTLCESYKPD